MSFALAVAVRVGAVAAGQSTELGQVTVNPDAEASCMISMENVYEVPLAGGLLKVNVVFSVSVWLKLLAFSQLTVVALLDDVTAA
jgi:hypothetical protein